MQSTQQLRENFFRRKHEFPNYFAEEVDLKDEISCSARITLISKCIEHIINHLTIPHIVDDSIARQSFFKHLNKHIKSIPEFIDVPIELSIGGGVVRSLIAYLYKYIYNKKLKNNLSTESILNNLLTKIGQAINHTIVLGVGSDFDIYYHLDATQSEIATKLQQSLMYYINAVEAKFGLLGYSNPLKKSFLPVADIKPYQEQIALIISQGGSNCDWLAFMVSDCTSQNKFITPKDYPDLLLDLLLKGEYAYNKAQSGVVPEQKQTIRGCRGLLELPFTKIKDGNLLMQELQEIKSINVLDFKSKDQIDKLVRNSNFGGANNRVYRSKPNNPLSRLAELSNEYHTIEKKYLIPHFLPAYKRTAIQQTELAVNLEKYLIDINEFIDKYTNKRVLYHGTSIDSFLSIIRSGFWISDSDIGQGASAYGPGVYCTANRDTAKSYTKGNSASIINIIPNKHYPSRIINWQNIEKDVQDNLEKQAISLGYLHVFYLLRKQYNIDIIINDAVIIQNLHAIKISKNLTELIDSRVLYLQDELQQEKLEYARLDAIVTEMKALYDLSLAIEHYKQTSWEQAINLCTKAIDTSIVDLQQQIETIESSIDYYNQADISSKKHNQLDLLLNKMLPLCEYSAQLGCQSQFTVANLIDKHKDLFIISEDYSCIDDPEQIYKYWDVISSVIYSKENVDVNHEKIKQAFILSVKYGFVNIMVNLLEFGIDINIKDDNGNSLAHHSAARKNVSAIVPVFQKMGLNFNVKNEYGSTPLHIAVRYENPDFIDTLVAIGLDVNEQDNGGNTCAYLAVENGNIASIEVLLKYKADFNIKNEDGETSALIAVSGGKTDIIEKLLGHADFNVTDSNGNALCHIAIKKEYTDIVKTLLGHADFNVTDKNGYTAICWATAKNNIEIVDKLINHGVDLDWQYDCIEDNFLTLRHEVCKIIHKLVNKKMTFADADFGDASIDLVEIDTDITSLLFGSVKKEKPFTSFTKKYGEHVSERMNRLIAHKMQLFETQSYPIVINLGDLAYVMGYEEILRLFNQAGYNFNIPSNAASEPTMCFAYQNYFAEDVSEESSDDSDTKAFKCMKSIMDSYDPNEPYEWGSDDLELWGYEEELSKKLSFF